jgi:GT2 family glycosyltransferase
VEPSVRVVVLNYNGGEYVLECLASIVALDWPAERLEVAVVDNASSDGSPDAISARFPGVQMIRNASNTGFSANNLALRDLGDVEYVALVNPDAIVDEQWLRELVIAAERDPTIGAVSPKMLLHDRLVALRVEADTDLDVRGVWIDGVDKLAASRVMWRVLAQDVGADHELRVPSGTASLPVAVPAPDTSAATLLLTAAVPGTARFGEQCVPVGPDPTRVLVEMTEPPRDVINNTGIEARPHGYFADRGLGAVDGPSHDRPQEVFGWTGGGALLRRTYLEDVGLFDEIFFLYYEDVDLSWRGRARGWRFIYAPRAVMRHHHATSTVEGSALFIYENERNHLVTLLKNAPLTYAGRCVLRFLWATLGYVRADVLRPLLRREQVRTDVVRIRLRVALSLVASLSAIRRARHEVQRRRTVSHDDVLAWLP